MLYWWPDDGWQRGTVAPLCPRGAFSHMVAYNRQTSALRGTADTLLATVTAPAGCCSRQPRRRVRLGPFDPAPPDPEFEFGRWLVTTPGPGPGGQRTPGPGGQWTFV